MTEIVAILHSTEYLGDHSRDTVEVIPVRDGETVRDLMLRAHQMGNGVGIIRPTKDSLVLKWTHKEATE